MSTTLNAGEAPVYVESQSPSAGWIRAKLINNPKIKSEDIDVLDRTVKRSLDIWHSDKPVMTLNNRQIFVIPKTEKFIPAQKYFLENEADKCYDRSTIQPLLLKDEN